MLRPLHTSLTLLEPPLAREATHLFKSALAYAGHRPCPHPPGAALAVLAAGHREPLLRAELYLQLLKQLGANPSAESTAAYRRLLEPRTRPPLRACRCPPASARPPVPTAPLRAGTGGCSRCA